MSVTLAILNALTSVITYTVKMVNMNVHVCLDINLEVTNTPVLVRKNTIVAKRNCVNNSSNLHVCTYFSTIPALCIHQTVLIGYQSNDSVY